jgi:hypothetical protein
MKILEILPTFCYYSQNVFLSNMIAYRIVFGNSFNVDSQPWNARTVAINIELDFFFWIKLYYIKCLFVLTMVCKRASLNLELSFGYNKDLFFSEDLGNCFLRWVNTSQKFLCYLVLKSFSPVTKEKDAILNCFLMIVRCYFYFKDTILSRSSCWNLLSKLSYS